MPLRPIVTLGDPQLRLPGAPVRRFDRQLHRLLDDMRETMREAPGVGLAAQQVGEALQVCVIEVEGDLHELVNPRIVELGGEQTDYEGCLSIPGYFALRSRADHAVVEGSDRRGRRVRVSGSGLLARAIQHEFDHLQGELYIDDLGPDVELITTARLREIAEAEEAAAEQRDGEADGGPRRPGRRSTAERITERPDEEVATVA